MATRRVKRIKRTKKRLQHGRRKTNRRHQTNRHRYTRRQRGGTQRTIVSKGYSSFIKNESNASGIDITYDDATKMFKIGSAEYLTVESLSTFKGKSRYARAVQILTDMRMTTTSLNHHQFIAFSVLYCKGAQDGQCEAIMTETKRLIRDNLDDAIYAMIAFPAASDDIRTMAEQMHKKEKVDQRISILASRATQRVARAAKQDARVDERDARDAKLLTFRKKIISYSIGSGRTFNAGVDDDAMKRWVSGTGMHESVYYDEYAETIQHQLKSSEPGIFKSAADACIENVKANKVLPAEDRANTTCFAPDLLTHRLACKTIIQKIGTNMGIDPNSEPSKDETGYFIQFMYPSQPVAEFLKTQQVEVKVYVHVDYSLGLYDVFLRFVFNENTICPSFYFIFVHFFQQINLCKRTGRCSLKKITVENFQMRDGYFIQFAIQQPKELFSETSIIMIAKRDTQKQVNDAQKSIADMEQSDDRTKSHANADNISMLKRQLATLTVADVKQRCPSYVEAVTNCLLTFCIEANQLYILPPDDNEFDCLILKLSPWSNFLRVAMGKNNSDVSEKIAEIKKRFSALQIEPALLKAKIASTIQQQPPQQPQQPQQSRQPRPQKGDDGTEMMEFVPTGNVVEFDTSDASADASADELASASGAAVPASDKATGTRPRVGFAVKPSALPNPDDTETIFPL
jgi:hypothetical protein